MFIQSMSSIFWTPLNEFSLHPVSSLLAPSARPRVGWGRVRQCAGVLLGPQAASKVVLNCLAWNSQHQRRGCAPLQPSLKMPPSGAQRFPLVQRGMWTREPFPGGVSQILSFSQVSLLKGEGVWKYFFTASQWGRALCLSPLQEHLDWTVRISFS